MIALQVALIFLAGWAARDILGRIRLAHAFTRLEGALTRIETKLDAALPPPPAHPSGAGNGVGGAAVAGARDPK